MRAFVAADVRFLVVALETFGAPMADITEADFARPGITYQIGLPLLSWRDESVYRGPLGCASSS